MEQGLVGSGFVGDPGEVFRQSPGDRQGDDFRQFIGVPGADGRGERRIAFSRRLDEQRCFRGLFDGALPAVNRKTGCENIDAGGQLRLDERGGQ